MKPIQSISIIGSGNVAHHLAKALYKIVSINEIIGYRRTERLDKLANLVDAKAIYTTSKINKTVDCILICIPDDLLETIINTIDYQGIIAHVSGSKGLEFANHDRLSYFYPLQTFQANQDVTINSIPFFVGAKKQEDCLALKELAQRISSSVFEITTEQKRVLHLSAVVVNNFVNHLFGLTNEYLNIHELDFGYLNPLIEQTIKNALKENPHNIQTGPAIRDDQITIQTHITMLKNHPLLQHVYQTLSKSIQDVQN